MGRRECGATRLRPRALRADAGPHGPRLRAALRAARLAVAAESAGDVPAVEPVGDLSRGPGRTLIGCPSPLVSPGRGSRVGRTGGELRLPAGFFTGRSETTAFARIA